MNDVIRLARQILNRQISQQTIPKQECMTMLAKLDLVLCSETIETLSISGCYKILKRDSNNFVQKYRRRGTEHSHMSLYKYYQMIQYEEHPDTCYIPHFVGGSGQPKYPVTASYARTTLLIHQPWDETHKPPVEGRWIQQFEEFIVSNECPRSVKIAYERVKQRHISKTEHVKPVAVEEPYDIDWTASMDDDTRDILNIANTFARGEDDDTSTLNGHKIDKGFEYDWAQPKHPVSAPKTYSIFHLMLQLIFYLLFNRNGIQIRMHLIGYRTR